MPKSKKKVRIKPLSVQNRNRAILFGFLAAFALVGFRSILFCIIFAVVAAANVFLAGKAKISEEAMKQKIKDSEQAYGDDLTEREKRFLQKYSDSDKDARFETQNWIEDRIRQMDAEDEYYDSLEEDDEGCGEDDYAE